jgi:hypothetical protein
MRPHECPREDEVLDAITSGRWPDGCAVSLHAHVAACEVCRDVADVALYLRDDGAALGAEVRVPSAGAVWWRAQARARAEAEQAAMRPMLVAAACGATVLVALMAAALTLGLPWVGALLGDSLAMLARVQPTVSVSADLVGEALERWLLQVVLAAVLLVAAPVALYLASE